MLEGYKDLRCYFPYTGADNFTVVYRSVRYIGIIYLFGGRIHYVTKPVMFTLKFLELNIKGTSEAQIIQRPSKPSN